MPWSGRSIFPVVLESVEEEPEGPDFEQRVAMARQIFKQT
jgi:hypothetical protein